jgi:drug/metabolite transporter (DMT)-like permease
MTRVQLALLLLLAATWGAGFLFIRIAAPAFGPFALIGLRVLLAGAVLSLYAVSIGRPPHLYRRWRAFLLIGTINAAIPFTLISTAELHLTASLAAIMNATTPLFGAVVAALWLRERIAVRQCGGLIVGLAGVVVLVGWSPIHVDGVVLLSIGASLSAAVCYAVSGVYIAHSLRDTPALTLAIAQQLGAGLVLFPLAVTHLPPTAPSGGVILAFLALSLLCTAVSYLIYFYLLAAIGSTKTLVTMILVPVFGVLWGAMFLGEPVGAGMLVGLVIVLAGVSLVTGTCTKSPIRPNETLSLRR